MAVSLSTNKAAAARMRSHHASMVAAVRERLGVLAQAALGANDWRAARDELVAHVRAEVLPHAQAEEATIYALAARRPRLEALIDAMVLEHGAIKRLTEEAATALTPEGALCAAAGIAGLFAAHAGIENDIILPPLESDPGVDVGEVLERMHRALSDAAPDALASAGSEGDAHLDVRTLPHSERHTLIFGLVGHLKPGRSLILTVNHDPLPLRSQLQAEYGDALGWAYQAEGPKEWRVAIRIRR